MEVRVRIAPSPTGYPHIGTIYQAMFDYCFAKKYNGKFIVRIEDTDRGRFVEGAEQVIFDSFKWFGLEPDEDPVRGGAFGPYRQSERLDIYQKYAQQLIEGGHAYYCFCTKERLEQLRGEQQKNRQAPKYDKKCLGLGKDEIERNLEEKTAFVIRLDVPRSEKIIVHDAIAGEVVFDSKEIDDQVLIKSDGFPTYHLAVVVDDYLMKITHVFRGTEWLPSTPKHVLLYRFLGWEESMPKFAHLPLLLDPENSGKLSKRKGNASVDFYKQEGFLPEAILNFMANIVWNHPEGTEIFSLKEFEKAFVLEPFKVNVKPVGAKFDIKKLEWINGEYIRKSENSNLKTQIKEYLRNISGGMLDHPTDEELDKLIPLIKERIKKLSDFIPLTDFLFEKVEYEIEVFKKLKIEKLNESMEAVLRKMNSLQKPWKAEDFESVFRTLAVELSISVSQMFQLIRIAVSGQTITPPLFESMQIMGEEEVIKRIESARDFVKESLQ